MSQFKTLMFCTAFIIGFTQTSRAQLYSSNEIIIAPSVFIAVEGNSTTVKEGEHLVFFVEIPSGKAKGSDNFATLQWQASTDNKNWQNIPKANGNIYETLPLTHIQYFRVIAVPIDTGNSIKIETISNVQMIGIESNVASSKE